MADLHGQMSVLDPYLGKFGENRLPRNERLCLYCNLNDIEDTYHFICICPCYNNLRLNYLNRYYYVRPSVYKFYELLNSHDRQALKKLGIFVKEALKIRCNANFADG